WRGIGRSPGRPGSAGCAAGAPIGRVDVFIARHAGGLAVPRGTVRRSGSGAPVECLDGAGWRSVALDVGSGNVRSSTTARPAGRRTRRTPWRLAGRQSGLAFSRGARPGKERATVKADAECRAGIADDSSGSRPPAERARTAGSRRGQRAEIGNVTAGWA